MPLLFREVINLRHQIKAYREEIQADSLRMDSTLMPFDYILAGVISNSVSRAHNYRSWRGISSSRASCGLFPSHTNEPKYSRPLTLHDSLILGLSNDITLDVAVPFVFIYVLVRLPLNLSVNWVLTIGFLTGLSVDIFANTQGMNALACTILAMSRRNVLHLYFPREDELTMTIIKPPIIYFLFSSL